MEFSKQIQLYVKHIDNALRRFIMQQPLQDTLLIQAMFYSVLLGGKRLRPLLVYATGEMFGVNHNVLDVPAAAIECIHAYSLVHDDLPSMDDDNTRRGVPTCHIKFGEASAILAGDALQTLAFSILSNAPMDKVTDRDRLTMISELATASGATGMCGGQALDLEANRKQINLDQLEFIHSYKTGALIRAAVRLGAFSAGEYGKEVLSILDRYAENIGLAFQIQDDIIDMISDTIKLTKSNNLGQSFKKKTYPVLLGLEQAQCKVWNLIDKAHKALQQLSEKSLNTSALKALANYIVQRNK